MPLWLRAATMNGWTLREGCQLVGWKCAWPGRLPSAFPATRSGLAESTAQILNLRPTTQ